MAVAHSYCYELLVSKASLCSHDTTPFLRCLKSGPAVAYPRLLGAPRPDPYVYETIFTGSQGDSLGNVEVYKCTKRVWWWAEIEIVSGAIVLG